MSAETSSRSAILAKVRAAIKDKHDEHDKHAAGETRDVENTKDTMTRNYRTQALGDRKAVLDRLVDRLIDYDAHVAVCLPGELAATVAALLARRAVELRLRRLVAPQGLPASAMPPGFDFVVDGSGGHLLTAAELDQIDGVVTSATIAIAETGTLVLQNAPGQGRRALSLVPDYHCCIVAVEDIVATVPEAFARLQATASLPTTFISGPSATADIEMTRIKGVHGPRFLDVLLVRSA